MQKILILENIRSVHNVGAIFRTADAVGINKIVLVGITPAPIDRFGRARADLAKAALGAEKTVLWQAVATIAEAVEPLRVEGFQIISLEQAENSVDYKKVSVADRAAIIVGNEVDGVSAEALTLSDVVAEIPMAGDKESLNVSVATGVALFRILDK
jgi:23S rRNA (guanosine2251-2'-O)-methyltransferase